VEQRFLETRTVADYARRLGYAGRTLSRATMAAGGTSPKAVIAARVLLEAKRLLVHTDLPIGRLAVHLGFSEATNFTKFFRKHAGLSPEAFREGALRIELC
ncbi:MAG TPA: helix-turn-helix transcriptional regulator, partial [Holophaga sp.]|nr:helix-turn-helix transcriptional regulator [Holophaga sp.]